MLLVWNTRNPASRINQESEKVFRRYCPGFKGFSRGILKNDEAVRSFFQTDYRLLQFDNQLIYSEEAFIRRCLSSSYSLSEQDGAYPAYIDALKNAFASCQTDGAVHTGIQTVAYLGGV